MVTSSALDLIRNGVNLAPPAVSDLPGSTDLRNLLHSMELKLPAELRSLVFAFASGIFRALADALETLGYIENLYRIEDSSAGWHQPFSQLYKPKGFRAETTDLLDETYLKRIVETSQSEPDDAIFLSTEARVAGLQVARGVYGLLDLRIIYWDGTSSNWMSNRRRDWITTYLGSDLRRLSTLSDVSCALLVSKLRI